MDGDTAASPCQACGASSAECELLRREASERDAHSAALQARALAAAEHQREQADTWRDKYERLYESHKRVQKLNQVLEEKLLQLVDRMKGEKAQLTKDIATLSVRLAHSKHTAAQLSKENERYKNDMNLAIQLLQCKPHNFVSQKLDNLPADTQVRVSQFVMSKCDLTASPNPPLKNGNELETVDTNEYEFNVSASLMSKILEDSLQDTVGKHCDTCTCNKTQGNLFSYDETHYSVATQTKLNGEMKNSLCLNCNGDVMSLKSNISNRSISPLLPRILNSDERVMHSSSPLNLKKNLAVHHILPQLHNMKPDILQQNTVQQTALPQNSIQLTTVHETALSQNSIQLSMVQQTVLPQNSIQMTAVQPTVLPQNLIQSTSVQLNDIQHTILPHNLTPPSTPRNVVPNAIQQSILTSNSALPQPLPSEKMVKENDLLNDKIKSEDKLKLAAAVQKEIVQKIGEDLNEMKNNFNMEPVIHHRLCDRTKSLGSNVSDINVLNDEPSLNEVSEEKEAKKEIEERKNSLCSAGAISRTSSVAKSTASTHRSNTHVGPGPRFCSLRVQAGSKNILLDNAQPDVPPVLYTRQTRCTDNILRADEDLILDEEKKDDNANVEAKVIESTLVDVHMDSTKGNSLEVNNVNHVLMNISASPLQPLKAHSYNPPEIINNNKTVLQNNTIDSFDLIETLNDKKTDITKRNGLNDSANSISSQGMKMFNFDLYEQGMLTNQYSRQLRKIDMSQLHSIENTKISKDLPPLAAVEFDCNKSNINAKSPNINVYPNVTQTQIKVTDAKKAVVAEQSTSSLSSDDSAAHLQKQQLIRVAEWVQQNLEQQNNLSPSATDTSDTAYPPKHRDGMTKSLEIVHKMPHPVTKYSHEANACITSVANANMQILSNTIVKETVFPVECDGLPQTTDEELVQQKASEKVHQRLERKVSAEELARMEYNVKKFLLSGSPWSSAPAVRSRRTSSKTETDL